jgi:hypothetical protein
MESLRRGLVPLTKRVGRASKQAITQLSAARLDSLARREDRAQRWVQGMRFQRVQMEATARGSPASSSVFATRRGIGRTSDGGIVDGRGREETGGGFRIQPARASPDTIFAHLDKCSIAPADGLRGRGASLSPGLDSHLSESQGGNLPSTLLETFPEACRLAVDAMCFWPYPSLGNKSLAQVIRFQRKEQTMVEESARRLAAGVDPGIVPARFLIGAARFAVDARLAPPAKIAENLYKELSRR